jgi:hypothetical protein
MVEVWTAVAEDPGYEPPQSDQCPVPLQRFLYLLMRDFIPPGYVESLMMQSTNETAAKIAGFTNKDLASYAEKLGRQLTYVPPA